MIWFKRLPSFFKRNRTPKVYSYIFIDIPENSGILDESIGEINTAVQIQEGPLEGMIYRYSKVQYLEDDNKKICHCKFEWVPISPPKNQPEVYETQELNDILGDILTDIIINYGETMID